MYTIVIIGPIVTATTGPVVAGCNFNEESINSHNQSLSTTQNTFGKTVNGQVFL